MAYALRYYKEIAQTDGGVVRLEIHKKDSTTSAVEIGAVVQGLSLEIQGQQDDIDTPIQKTSLHMTFVDASDIENGQKNGFWEEFYTPDALMWKVVLKAKDAGETSFRTIWGGYVTPDSFSEDLVYRGSVSITARDNIGHMQDFPFDALGDKDGLISLYNLVSMGWEKIQSPMDLLWNGLDWLSCNDVIAYHTLMNVSQFKDMNWYKAIETALASYGAVMRYAGENEVYVTTLRYMPSLGRNIDLMDRIEPVFIAGAQRELVPAVKRIEESVRYDIKEAIFKPVTSSDYTGDIDTFTIVGNSVDKTGIATPINNRTSGSGWCNPEYSLFFNPNMYEFGTGNEDAKYMWLSANNGYYYESGKGVRYAEYSRYVNAESLVLNLQFGSSYYFAINGKLYSNSDALQKCLIVVKAIQNGVTSYLQTDGSWNTDVIGIEVPIEGNRIALPIDASEFTGTIFVAVQIHQILTEASEKSMARYVPLYSASFSHGKSLREKNTVNTIYNADNNVILSRDPEIGPAFDKVALPEIIKNGIFYRNGDEILPARLWSWGGSEQQMAVWNHLQLLCYYAKPNNLISGTIVNADITRVAAIYEWNHAEHILVSGRYNFLNGHIEGAVLREFARYEDMWSEVAGAAMPETEQDSRSNVEGGASSSASPSTYTATQNVNIGTGGGGGTGASQLNDLTDVDTTGVVAQSVLYYNGTSWVDMSFASLVNPLLNPYLKSVDANATYATKEVLSGVETALSANISANATAIAGLGTRMTNAETELGLRYSKTEVNNLLAKYLLLEAESQTIKGNITIEGNLVITGDTSTGGTGSNPEVAGTLIGIKVNGTTYDKPVNGILTIPDYPTSLEWSAINGKPTKLTEFTNDAGFITSAALNGYAKTSDLPTSLPASDVYEWAKKSSLALADVPDLSSKYLPLSGGTIGSGLSNSFPLLISSTKAYTGLAFYTSGGTGYFRYQGGSTWSVTDAGWNNSYTLYHTGNFNPADYLPLSGGTIDGPFGSLIIHRTDAVDGFSGICFTNEFGTLGYIGMGGGKSYFGKQPTFFDGSNSFALIHSGNIESQKVAAANKLVSGTTNTLTANGVKLNDYYGHQILDCGSDWFAFGATNTVGVYQGSTIQLKPSGIVSMILNSSGNVTFGASDLAGTSWKACINGSTRIANITITSGVLNANRNANTGALLDSSKMGFEIEPFASYVALKGYNTSGTGVGGVNITSSGNVLIGTTEELRSGTKLQVSGYALSTRGWLLSGDYGMWKGSTFSGSLVETDIAYNATKHIFFSGNVGISVANPQYKLDVNGSGRFGHILINKGYGSNVGDDTIEMDSAGATLWMQYYHNGGINMCYGGGQVTMGGKLSVAGAVTMSSTLSVTGTGSFYGVRYEPRTFVPSTTGWYRVYKSLIYSRGDNVRLNISRNYNNSPSGSYTFDITVGYQKANITQVGSAIHSSSKYLSNVRVIFDGNYAYIDVYISGNSNSWYVSGSGRGEFQSGVINTETANVFATLSPVENSMVVGGNLVVAGDTSTGSDIRFKDKLADHRIALSDIADAPLFTFKWNDREDDSVHLGSSAQYWEKVAPWLVKGEDFKTLDYSTLGVAIGISLANKTLNLEDRVKILEKENKALKEQIRRIQYGS